MRERPVAKCQVSSSMRGACFAKTKELLIKSHKTMTTSLIVLLASLLAAQVVFGQHDSFASQQDGTSASNSITDQLEIPVQPFSQVRIECKLPQTANNGNKFFHWLYQPTGGKVLKPTVFCYESKCNNENLKRFGVQLMNDQESGVYDLLINNVTYELNDGIYYCDHTDSEANQTISREIKIIVLSKYILHAHLRLVFFFLKISFFF